MGRMIKRVPLDFDYPLHKVWIGYLNPYSKLYMKNCADCKNSGISVIGRILKDLWYGWNDSFPMKGFKTREDYLKQMADTRLRDHILGLIHRVETAPARKTENGHSVQGWIYNLDEFEVKYLWTENRLRDFKEQPDAEQVNQWALRSMGHDSLNQYLVSEFCAQRWGYDAKELLWCSTCRGHGHTFETGYHRYICENWVKIEPPTGEGWQLWETVSEGSPISPVFADKAGLAQFMVETEGISFAGAMNFIDEEWAPSFIMVDGVFQSGVQFIADNHESEKD